MKFDEKDTMSNFQIMGMLKNMRGFRGVHSIDELVRLKPLKTDENMVVNLEL